MDGNENSLEGVKIEKPPKLALIICTVAILTIGLIGGVYEYILQLH
jgi:hypothetical protein